MKRKNAFLLLVMSAFGYLLPLHAIPVVTIHYQSSCSACGTVHLERELVDVTINGETKSVLFESIDCSGFGFKGCPKASKGPGYYGTFTNWVEEISLDMYDYAHGAIHDNGSAAGNHTQTYVNSTSGETITLFVSWTATFDSNGEILTEEITVWFNN